MKALLIVSICSALTLPACKTPAQNQRLGALVKVAVTAAQARHILTPQDAADILAAESIILPPVEVTSGK